MNDGTARTTTANNVTYVVEVLAGRSFALDAQATLDVGDVATDLDIAAENDDQGNDGRISITGPFGLVFDDLPIEDAHSRTSTAVFTAADPLVTGTWFLSSVSAGLTRGELELPVVFTDFLE